VNQMDQRSFQLKKTDNLLMKNHQKRQILVVDDDYDLRENLVEILNAEGYGVQATENASKAFEKLQQTDFDIVILDFMMPGMNGIEALYELKRIAPKTKVIMITAFATIENAVNAIKRGASEFITKPFKIEELLILIKQVLEELRFEYGIKKLEMEDTLSSLSNSIRRQIIRILQSNKEMRLMQIVRELEVKDHTKVIFHLKTLKESKIIEQTSEKSYFLTLEGQKILECLILLEKYFDDNASPV